MIFKAFKFAPDEGGPGVCCSGRHRSNVARPGDVVVLPAAAAKNVAASMPGALKPITGNALKAVYKACDVKTLEELADLPHADLQAGRSALSPAPKAPTTPNTEAEPEG